MPGHSGYPFPVASEPPAAILDRDGYSKRDHVSSSASQRSLDLAGRGPVSDGLLATFGVVILVIQPIAIVVARTIPSDGRDSKRMVASFAAERDEVDPTRAQAPLLAAVDSASQPRVVAMWIRGESR